MEDLFRLLAGYLRGMWRYRWWGLALTWVVGIVGGIAVFQMPDRYTSSARVYVDTQSVLRPLMSGLAVQANVSQQIAVLSRTLITRPNVDKLITMADLDLEIRTPQDREALVSELMNGLKIADGGRRGGANLFMLRFEDGDPERAQRIVQALMSLFVESGLVGKRHDTDSARRFIDDQIRSYEQRLTEAENRMTEFRLQHLELLSGDARGFVGQMTDMNARLEQAQLELREAERLRENLRQQLASEQPTVANQGGDFGFGQYSELDGRIDELNRQLDALLLRYTDQHPDVISTRRIIENLSAQREKELAQREPDDPNSNSVLSTNPVYQQLKISLGHADSQVSVLRTRVDEFQERLDRLRGSAEMRPKIEAELTQLDRDYNIHKRNYEQLVQRRETASMSAEMEAQSIGTEFRVIDPPNLPNSPSAPNRILLVGLAGIAAIGAGIALTFLLSQLRPAISDSRSLRELAGLPVLGSVSLIADPSRVRRERLGIAAFAGALCGFGALMGATAVAIQVLQT